MFDTELYDDLSIVCNRSIEDNINPMILQRLAEKSYGWQQYQTSVKN